MDDDPAARRRFVRTFEGAYGLAFVDTRAELMRRVRSGGAHLLILEVVLPGDNGIDLCRAVRDVADVPVVLVSAVAAARTIAAGLGAGASDYVTKPFSPLVLRARVHNALRLHRGLAAPSRPGAVRIGPCTLFPRERVIRNPAGMSVRVTEMESKVLMELARRAGQVADRDALSRILTGGAWSPTNRALDVHVSNLRIKLVSLGLPKTVLASARGRGYRLLAGAEFAF